eukprot:4341256-Alexandrium_andersonii.AAC.1
MSHLRPSNSVSWALSSSPSASWGTLRSGARKCACWSASSLPAGRSGRCRSATCTAATSSPRPR